MGNDYIKPDMSKLINKVNPIILTALKAISDSEENKVGIHEVLLDDMRDGEVKLKVMTSIRTSKAYQSGYKYIGIKVDSDKSAVLRDIRRINLYLKACHKKVKAYYGSQYK